MTRDLNFMDILKKCFKVYKKITILPDYFSRMIIVNVDLLFYPEPLSIFTFYDTILEYLIVFLIQCVILNSKLMVYNYLLY